MAQGITIDFNANLARFSAGLDKATADLRKFQTNTDRIAGQIKGAFGGLAAGLSVGAFGAFIKSNIDAADEIGKLSQKIGIGVNDLAGWQFAAGQAGLATETFEQAASKLNTLIAKTPEKLKSIGVTAGNADQALLQLADVFLGIQDPARKAAMATELFGERAGRDMVPLLAQGSEALRGLKTRGQELNPVTEEMARRAEAFNDSLDVMRKRAGSVGISFATALLPSLNNVLGQLEEGVRIAGSFSEALKFGWDVNPFVSPGDNIKAYRAELKSLEDTRDKLLRGENVYKDGRLFLGFDLPGMDKEIAEVKKRIEFVKVLRAQDLGLPSKSELAREASRQKAEVAAQLASKGFTNTEASAIQDAFRKAFSTKPLDDLLASFPAKRQAIEKEMRLLQNSLTGTSTEGAKGFDIMAELSKGRGALAGGDQIGVDIATERAKEMLKGLKDNGGIGYEFSYFSDQIKKLQLDAVDAQEAATKITAGVFQSAEIRLQREAESMDPVKLKLDQEFIAIQFKTAVAGAMLDISNNPLQVPAVFTPIMIGQSVPISTAALKFGSR